jgi:hypothetical protein
MRANLATHNIVHLDHLDGWKVRKGESGWRWFWLGELSAMGGCLMLWLCLRQSSGSKSGAWVTKRYLWAVAGTGVISRRRRHEVPKNRLSPFTLVLFFLFSLRSKICIECITGFRFV